MIQIVRVLWLAIKPFYMSVYKHGFCSSFISYFGFLCLSHVLPTSRVFTSGYVNTETILHFFNIILCASVYSCAHRYFNPCSFFLLSSLHPKIRKLILHSVLHTFPVVLSGRICLTIWASLLGDHFPYSHDLNVWFNSGYCKEKLDAITLKV